MLCAAPVFAGAGQGWQGYPGAQLVPSKPAAAVQGLPPPQGLRSLWAARVGIPLRLRAAAPSLPVQAMTCAKVWRL